MIIFAWVLLSLVGAFIASTKRRSFRNFLLLGLVASPVVGLAAAAFAKRDDEQIQEDMLATGKMRICGNCRNLVKWNAAACSECKASLEPVSTPSRWNGIERRMADNSDYLDVKRRRSDLIRQAEAVPAQAEPAHVD